MKKILLSILLAAATYSYAQITETATEAVKNMGLGWNLGNTLDAYKCTSTDVNSDNYWNGQGLDSETWWGQPVTKKELMTMMKEAGFGAIRVPVTWFNHMDKSGKVNAAWMKRVHEVVDYVIDNGMYCIINVHHDTGADGTSNTSWLKADMTYYNNNKARYEYLWKQIAEEFKDYDNHLLFESYNEMLDVKSSWCFASFAASGSYDSSIATSAYNAINSYAQSFVDVVRATGSNNASRNLIVNTYASACGEGNYMWNTHLNEPLTNMKLPADKVSNHIIFEVHCYPSLTSNGSNKTIAAINTETYNTMKNLKNKLVSKGAPVIFGEWGIDDGNDSYNNRHDLMLQFVDYFVKQAKTNGMGTFYWMGLSDGVYRDRLQFNQADVAETMAKAYHGSTFNGKFPNPSKSSYIVSFEGEKAINWGQGITIPADEFKNIGEKVQLEMTYKQTSSSPDLQFYYGDWSAAVTFSVGGKTYTSDFLPGSYYKTGSGTEHTTVFSFDSNTQKSLAVKGLVIHGVSATIKKIVLYDPSVVTDGISTVSHSRVSDNTIYNLSGQKVARTSKGLYILNGKKFIVR